MAALVVARIVWGFWGSTYARFSSFVTRPGKAFSHLRGALAGTEARHLGHNPAGGWMILALLLSALALALTGAVALGGMLKIGPFAALATFANGRDARELHELLAWALLALIGLHVAGAIGESLRTRDNLVRAMVTGAKNARPGDHEVPFVRSRPVLAIVAGLVLIGGGAVAVDRLAARPAPGVPAAPLDAAYAAECGDCHMPYHPSLLPAESWHALFAGLDDHFGENASLPAETVATLEAYVTANAAGNFDTLPANVFRRVSPDAPYQITATPFWKRRHAEIDDAVFRSPAVGARGNCAACHRDAATGIFDPRRISIPKETSL
jgi:cytochrome b